MKVNSPKTTIEAPNRKIFEMMSDCSRFGEVVPEQFSDWEAGEDYFRFSFQGLVTMTLRIAEKTEYSKIVYSAENTQNIPAFITIDIDGDDRKCDVEVGIDIEVPVFLSGMVKKPLQNFVDKAVEKMKIVAEKQ
ncbi:SRPBCC family protein [Bacteroidales bacterium OttesenSCG-928-C03]|nr:SRPBCC family protein [Bacteroidales bacterium OttesenSCG-928-E04]MDL2308980.1 SRPBCC family protein [Bacteroidales bacterium OttesenSCG-928-C03]